MTHASRTPVRRRAFSVLEILIVVLILAILGALVVPQFSLASSTAQQSTTLRDDVRYLRTQIMVYRAQHRGISPGYPQGNTQAAPTEAAFVGQLTLNTNGSGQVAQEATSEFKFGPYLQRIPLNVLNHSSRIRFIGPEETFPTHPGGDEGWLYQPSTGTIVANVAGEDKNSVPFFDY